MNPTIQQVPDAQHGLDLDTQLFEAKGPCVHLWTATQQALVCPRAYQSRSGFDAAVEASANQGWPVSLRPTGGGTVPQGPGIANLALAFNAPKDFTIEDGYRLLTDILKSALPLGDRLAAGDTPGSFCDGAWNLSIEGQKLVGTAQKWRPVRGGKPRVLAHAMIIVTEQFQPGANAVSAFHDSLGLPPVTIAAHTSLQAVMGLDSLPAKALHETAVSQMAKCINQT